MNAHNKNVGARFPRPWDIEEKGPSNLLLIIAMSQNLYPEPSLDPLRLSNVVIASLRIYRDNFKSYIIIALQAYLWGFIPVLAIFGLYFLNFAAFQFSQGLGVFVLLVSIVGWVYLLLYFAEKSLRNLALISRLVFQLLNNQPETVEQARGQLPNRRSIFVLTQFTASFLIVLAYHIPLIGIVIYFWVFARLFIPEVAVAIEKTGPVNSISRSWNLTATFTGKTMIIIFLAHLILVIYAYFLFLGMIVISFTVGSIIPFIPLLYFVDLLCWFPLIIFTIPLWQALKGVIYFDLRSRQEVLETNPRAVDDNI